jgi:hypothetical protein
MKKLATLVFALLLTGSLAFAQGAPDTTKKADDTTKGETTKKHKGGKKGHKGGKKGKKGAETTPATDKK